MNKNIGVFVGMIALVAVIGGVYSSMDKKDDAMVKEIIVDDKKMVDTESMMDKKEVMMDKEETSIVEKKETMAKAGSYESYSMDKITRAETGDVVLFFHASWCPSCRGLNSSIEGNLSSIPQGVSILKVDYDKETELKKKYGVTYQHTLVQVDAQGNMLKKWSGSSNLTNLLSQIQ